MSRSEVLAKLEAAWAGLQARTPDLPDATIVFGSRGPVTVPGVFEAYVPADYERFGFRIMLGALGHEAAHMVAEVRHAFDTSRQGRYHNAVFTEIVVELGFKIHVNPARILVLPRGVAHLDQVPTLHCRPQRVALAKGGKPRASCLCNPSRSFIMSPMQLSLGEISCSICHAPFERREDGS
jgi:hypothetical protein